MVWAAERKKDLTKHVTFEPLIVSPEQGGES
jgi:hypothetical protein